MTRKEFLQTVTGVAAATALSTPAQSAAEKRGPKRGVSLYCYVGEVDVTCTLEDALAEVSDLGVEGDPEIGVEILGAGVIHGYPKPTAAWMQNWHAMMAKYHLKPVEYGHWVDSQLYHGLEGPTLSTKESYEQLVQDIKLANLLGFTCGRTKIGVAEADLFPVANWREFIKRALPVAEKYNFRMLSEVHTPTLLKGRVLDEQMDFITKEKCTPWFGLNIDFSVFQNRPTSEGRWAAGGTPGSYSQPEELIPLLPYVHCCHAKFNEISEDCEDMTIPYAEVVKIMIDHNWDGYLLSEYEGRDKATGGARAAVRRQHVLLKRLLGEA